MQGALLLVQYRHLHIFVYDNAEKELLETVQGLMRMVARSTTTWIGLGTLLDARPAPNKDGDEDQSKNDHPKKKLPLTLESLEEMLITAHDFNRKKKFVFWNCLLEFGG